MRPLHQLDNTVSQRALVAAAFAASLFFGNAAYLGLSVAFINMLKALTPVATLLTGYCLGGGAPSPGLIAATALIAAGTATATAQEATTSHFSAVAFASFALSIVFEAIRMVLSERLLQSKTGTRMSAVELMAHVGPLTGLMLAAGSALVEGPGIAQQVGTGEGARGLTGGVLGCSAGSLPLMHPPWDRIHCDQLHMVHAQPHTLCRPPS